MVIGIGLLLVLQTVMLVVLLARLAPGRTRRPPVDPALTPSGQTTVSVVVATLNEAGRLTPCLDGLRLQGPLLTEVLIVDSNSRDGTRDLVAHAATRDPRVRLVPDDTPPPDWIGKVWALELGLREATSEWVLGIDADTVPKAGLVGAVVAAAERDAFDVVSFAPRFVGQSSGERLVQPAMLTTLVYRCGATGVQQPPPHRVLANGQCFLARRAVLQAHGGFSAAQHSFSDDVTLARHLARRGVRVGFLDGSRIIDVRSYASLREMWREWGRSFDLKDATPVWLRWFDLVLVWSMQALPLPVLLWLAFAWRGLHTVSPGGMGAVALPALQSMQPPMLMALVAVNAFALFIRLSMLAAMRHSYATRGAAFWCSWLADIPAALRLTWSTLQRPRAWRGRQYEPSALPTQAS